ncbi:MAG: NADH-quinone oxidoreductase subunit F [Actinomycetes bacterium]
MDFYKHESCGKCTPCREGTWWIDQLLHSLQAGTGKTEDLKQLEELCAQILGRSFCALGDAAATPYPAAMKYFANEFEDGTHISANAQFNPTASIVFPGVTTS